MKEKNEGRIEEKSITEIKKIMNGLPDGTILEIVFENNEDREEGNLDE